MENTFIVFSTEVFRDQIWDDYLGTLFHFLFCTILYKHFKVTFNFCKFLTYRVYTNHCNDHDDI